MSKPYFYTSIDRDYGKIVSGSQTKGFNWNIKFEKDYTCFTGWDCDRHRFVVESYLDKKMKPKKPIKGSWRWRLYYD